MNSIWTKYSFYMAAALCGLLIGCSENRVDEGGNQETQRAQPAAGADRSDDDSILHLTQLQVETAGIKTDVLQKLPLRDVIKVNGYLSVPPDRQAKVSPVIGGAVVEIHVREGDQVRAGQVLAELASPAFLEMQADFRKISSSIDFLEEEFNRREQLFNDGVGSRREYHQSRSEYEAAVAEKQYLESTLSLLRLDVDRILRGDVFETAPVIAPIDGFVEHVSVTSGQYTDPATTMFEIVDTSHIHADLMVYERDADKVERDQEVLFRYNHQSGDQVYRARIFSVGKTLEESPRALRVHAEIEHSDDLLPGMYIEGRIVTGSATQSALPEEAVLRNGSEHLVFILLPNSGAESDEYAFQAVPVRQGVSDNGFTEVHFFEPIPEEARFVTEGAYYLLTEMEREG